jgi:hypothetical protein
MKKRSGLMEPAKDWIRQIHLSFAYDFGPKEPPEGQEDPIDSYATMFWGSALLVVGFLLQVVSQLPWLESNFQAVTQTVSQAPSWKHWAVGLSFSVVGGFIIGPSLHLLRY